MNSVTETMPPLVILGAGGHAKVLLALAQAAGFEVRGICDPGLAAQGVKEWGGVPLLGDDNVLNTFDPAEIGIVNGVGQIVGNRQRQILYEKTRIAGFQFPPIIHPNAWVASGVRLENGVQVMAGAVIQPDASIGENTIINTNASVDHDCNVGAHVHIAPGATLCGGVSIGDGAFIGSGATIIQGMNVGTGAVVGAGVTLVKDLNKHLKILGAPTRLYHH